MKKFQKFFIVTALLTMLANTSYGQEVDYGYGQEMDDGAYGESRVGDWQAYAPLGAVLVGAGIIALTSNRHHHGGGGSSSRSSSSSHAHGHFSGSSSSNSF